MADVETSTTWANLLREMRGPLVEALKWKTVLLAEVKRNKNPQLWSGKQITIPVILAPQQGTQMVTESGVVGPPIAIDDTQANIQTAIIEHSISFSTQAVRAARNTADTSWAEVIPTKMRMAEDSISRVMNEQMCGDGTGLLAAVTGAGGSPGLAVPVGTSANFYQLYANRVVDVRTRASGADPGNGLARKIASNSPSAGTVTFNTAAVYSGAGSGNITFSANEGVYIQNTGPGTGTWATPAQVTYGGAAVSVGQALGGIQGAVATTGTFQGINKANVPAWQGTNGSPAAATDPTMSVFDGAERKAIIAAGQTPDFYLCDPAVVDKYQQLLAVQARWSGTESQLSSGFTGVQYRNKTLVPEYDMAPSTAIGVSNGDSALYSLDDGPDWDDLTGARLQRFARSLPVEAWLLWMVQYGFTRCNTFVKVGNLNQAS